MELKNFPFQTIDWSSIPAEEHKGETGVAYWKVQMMNDIRVREVVYTPATKPIIGAAKVILYIVLKGACQQN